MGGEPCAPCSERNVSWGKLPPRDPRRQIYSQEDVFVDALAECVSGRLRAGERVVVMATAAYRRAVAERLRTQGVDLDAARRQEHYLPVEADETLAPCLVPGWPDAALFAQRVMELFARTRRHGRRVRVFGERVTLLWAHEQHGPPGRLAHLWQSLCTQENRSGDTVTVLSMCYVPGQTTVWSF